MNRKLISLHVNAKISTANAIHIYIILIRGGDSVSVFALVCVCINACLRPKASVNEVTKKNLILCAMLESDERLKKD